MELMLLLLSYLAILRQSEDTMLETFLYVGALAMVHLGPPMKKLELGLY
jgi:hypothetical protein